MARLRSVPEKFTSVRLARVKLAFQPTALLRSDPDRTASSKHVKLNSASSNLARSSLARLNPVEVSFARLKTASVRSSPPNMSMLREQPVQSTRGRGGSWQSASADWARANASRAGRQQMAFMGLLDKLAAVFFGQPGRDGSEAKAY